MGHRDASDVADFARKFVSRRSDEVWEFIHVTQVSHSGGKFVISAFRSWRSSLCEQESHCPETGV
jgi:hypothetical protein